MEKIEVKKNTPFIGNIAYSQREYSYDNYLMELVRHTIEFMKKTPCGSLLLGTVKDEVKQVVGTTPGYRIGDRRKIIDQNIKNVVRHAYYHEYRSLQQLCILILRNEQHQYGNGTRNVYGILFDGAQRLFDGNHGLIYPDFIGKDAGERIIADAKYKPWNNISGKDYLQILAYMFRFDAKRGYYLYPEATHQADVSLRLNRGMTYEDNVSPRNDVLVIKCGLQIPDGAKDYADFVARMEENETAFRDKIWKTEA